MKTKNKPLFTTDILILIPNIILVTIVPLIVYLKIIPVDEATVPFFDNKTENFDFFSYYKSIWIIILSSITVITYAICLIIKRDRHKKYYSIYIPVALYLICIIISAAKSEYEHTALIGFPDRYEGVFILLSYIAVFISTVTLVKNSKQVKFLLSGIIFSSTIIGIIGLFQYIGLDIFTSSFSRSIILSPEYRNTTAAIKTSSEAEAIYSTLYNPNNFGIYISMMFCISFCLFLFFNRKSLKTAALAYSCLMFINLLGSNSRGSIAAAFISTLLIIILIRKQIRLKWKPFTGILIIYTIIFAGMNSFGGGTLSTRLESMVTSKDLHKENASIDKIKSFEIKENQLTLRCTNSSLIILIDNGKLIFNDDNSNNLAPILSGQDKSYTFDENKYKDYTIIISQNMLKIQKGISYLYFAVSENTFLNLNNRGEVVQNVPVESFGFSGMERIGSGRGYIWSRTLPLLKNTLLIGHGPDTFAMYFPQNDYIGKLRYMYDANLIIDKPHNMYLQTAVNTGVLSLLALLAIIAVYWFVSIKFLFRQGSQNSESMKSFSSIACLSIFAAISSYLVAGMFTDSTVSVSPTFWVLLGIGISLRQYIKEL